MDSDKFIFSIIGGITVLILAFILGSSILKQPQSINNVDYVLGNMGNKLGAEQPKLTLVEFSDFQCPSCKFYEPVVKSLVEKYPNDLAVVYRHFPLPVHNMAIIAAKASEAAAIQGKFWEYSEVLFQNQPNFSESELIQYASDLGLNVEQFSADLNSKEVIEIVNNDYKVASDLNLPGTPTFFVVYDGNVEQINLQFDGDLESKVAEILGVTNEVSESIPSETTPSDQPEL